MEAAQLREVDKLYHIHQIAFQSFRVQAMKRAGKHRQRPVFSTFRKFFDYEKALRQASGKDAPSSRFEALKNHLRGEV